MARMPNFMFYDNKQSPWGTAMSSLGQALFGDPAEIRAREAQAAENEYRSLQMEKMRFDLDAAKQSADDDAAFADMIIAGLQGGSSPAATPTGPEPAVSASPLGSVFDEQTAAPGAGMVGPVTQGPPMADASTLPQSQPGYLANLYERESGGDPNAQSATSSAAGLYGFTDPTWQSVGGQGSARDATPAEQTMRVSELTNRNRQQLAATLGREPTDAELYAAHHFGGGGGEKMIAADPATSLGDIFSPGVMKANAYLGGQNAGDWRTQAAVDFPGSTWDGSLPSGDGAPPAPGLTTLAEMPGGGVTAERVPAEAPPQMQTAAGPGADGAQTLQAAFTPPPQQPAPQAAQPRTVQELISDLKPYEINQIMAAPKSEWRAVLMDIANDRATAARKAEGEGGDAAIGATIQERDSWRIMNLDPADPNYAMAYRRLYEDPHYVQGTDSEGRKTINEVYQAPPPGVRPPTGGGYQPMQPRTLDEYGQPVAQPTGGGAGGGGNAQVIGGVDPLPAEAAGRVGAVQGGWQDLRDAIGMYFNADGKTLDTVNVWNSTIGMPWSEGRGANQAMMAGIQGIWRTMTGAAMPDSERAYFEQMFLPSGLNREVDNRRALARAVRWNKSMENSLLQGRGSPNGKPMTEDEMRQLTQQIMGEADAEAPKEGDAATPAGVTRKKAKMPDQRIIYSDDGATWFYEDDGTQVQ